MPTNKDTIRMHLERHLIETEQKGNLSAYALSGYCEGYYGELTLEMIDVIMELIREGWVLV